MGLRLAWLLLVSLALGAVAACNSAGQAQEPTVTVERLRPTERVRPTTTPSYADLPQGRTPEGYPYLGAADAPVTLVMFSDFL